MQGTAIGNDSFRVPKTTSGINPSLGATEICDSRCRNDKFCAVAGMERVTMRAVGACDFTFLFISENMAANLQNCHVLQTQ